MSGLKKSEQENIAISKRGVKSVNITVRGYHLDVYQHVNNARYLEFLEEARWQWLEESGDLAWCEKHAVGFVVANINISYRKPALLNQHLQISCQLTKLSKHSGLLTQFIHCAKSGDIIADAIITFVCVDLQTQRVLSIEGELQQRLGHWLVIE
ncbi:MAG: acyl-CoA thioesterase [Plesiomonas sp.]|uniref:acyl-CoA thioesterase n=1 Tax=Plesiomonas sp. TaxID=2486279 RepID=UPI003F3D168C